MPGRAPDAGELVNLAREQYAAVLEGHGKAWMESGMPGPDGEWRVFWTQKSWVVFDETSARVAYEETVHAAGGQILSDTKVEYFRDGWREKDGPDTTGSGVGRSRSHPTRQALDAHPIHHMGLFPKSPLTLLEEAKARSQLEVTGRETCAELDCIVLEGTTVEANQAYPLRVCLAEARGYLPVKLRSALPQYDAELVAHLEYRKAGPGVCVLSKARSEFTSQGSVVKRQDIVFAPDFTVNAGAHADVGGASSLFPDEGMWDDPWWPRNP